MKMLVLLVVAGFGLIVALTHFLVKEMVPNVLGFTFGILQMVLYMMYKDNKKTSLPTDQLANQVIILDQADKLPEQIIDIVKLGGLQSSEKTSLPQQHA
ncbi:hypothetical protein Leryth_002237 [Lithospermum erythrorhizon]|nr:hypothetical protein Leryth_002237 [Lithospermum erythrorhizon]